MIKIYRRPGHCLNPNDDVVNKLLQRIENNDGICPCPNNSKDPHCPCTWYTEKGVCRCGLYLKIDK